MEEEALTMMPTVVVGVMAVVPEKVQLEKPVDWRQFPAMAKHPVKALKPLAPVEVAEPEMFRPTTEVEPTELMER